MATYMEAFIEYESQSGESEPFSGEAMAISSLTAASFTFQSGGCNYAAFDALAYGRSARCTFWPDTDDPNAGPAPPLPKFPARGLPQPCSLTVATQYFYLVTPDSNLPDRHFWPAHRCVSPETADEWTRDHGCWHSEVIQSFNLPPPGEYLSWRAVSEPHLHHASWLTPDEYEEAFVYHNLNIDSEPTEFRVILDAMQTMERRIGAGRVRLVFWFS